MFTPICFCSHEGTTAEANGVNEKWKLPEMINNEPQMLYVENLRQSTNKAFVRLHYEGLAR